MKKTKRNQTQHRELKVYEKYFSRSGNSNVVYPEIRLCEKWLQDMGFECGQRVAVHQEKKKITITIDNTTEVEN